MSKEMHYARPYAVAAFEVATAAQTENEWLAMLSTLSFVTTLPAIAEVLKHPHYTEESLVDLYFKLAGDFLTEQGKNFMRLLAASQRLAVLPDIAQLFEGYVAAKHKTVEVQVESAVPLTPAYQAQLQQVLKKRFGKDPVLHCRINAELIGGLRLQAGDTVIDGSVKSQLGALKKSLIGEVCN